MTADGPAFHFELPDTTLAAIRGTPATIFLMMHLYAWRGQPTVSPELINRVFRYSDHTIHDALNTLAHYGLAEQNSRYSWRLAAGAHQLPLMQYLDDGQQPGEDPPTRNNCDSHFSPDPDPPQNESQLLRVTPAEPVEAPQQGPSAPPTEPRLAIIATRNLRLEATCLSNSLSSSLNPEKEKEKQLLLKLTAARDALKAAELSPDQVDDFAQRYPPERVLHACDVYEWASHTQQASGKKYATDKGYLVSFLARNWTAPRQYVPAELRCPECYRRTADHRPGCPATHPALPADPLDDPSAPDDCDRGPANGGCTHDDRPASPSGDRPTSALAHRDLDAWQCTVDQLRAEMTRGLFDSYVKDLAPLGLRDQVYRLHANNRFAADWVDQRLGARIERLLTNILNQPVKVQIVTGKEQ